MKMYVTKKQNICASSILDDYTQDQIDRAVEVIEDLEAYDYDVNDDAALLRGLIDFYGFTRKGAKEILDIWHNWTDRSEKSLSPWNSTYKGYKIRLNPRYECYDVYDSNNELEDSGFISVDQAKNFIDELLYEDIE